MSLKQKFIVEKKHDIVKLGLKEITKADLEIKSNQVSSKENHILGNPNYELTKSKLVVDMLRFGLQEIEIPFNGPKNSLLESIVSRKFPTSDVVSDTLRDLISQLTRLYQVSTAERESYVAMALDKITDEVTLSTEELSNLKKDISFILKDGIIKTFRDTVGRQVPIPDSSAMASLVTRMISNLKTTIEDGKSIIQTSDLAKMVREYAIIERRAFLSSSEFDKRQIYDELTRLMNESSDNTAVNMLVKNRLEYTVNASTGLIRMSMSKFSDMINNPVLILKPSSIDTPIKIMSFDCPSVTNNVLLEDVDNVSITGLMNYIEDFFGAISVYRTTGDINVSLFGTEDVELPSGGNQSEDKKSSEIVKELHMMYFKMDMLVLLSQSFTTIPPFNSISLAKITQSLNSKLDVYTIEPFIMAIDNVKMAYISSFKKAISSLKKGLYCPTDAEIDRLTKRSEIEPVFRYMFTAEHSAAYADSKKDAFANFSERLKSLMAPSVITESTWNIGRKIVKEATGTNLVSRGILYQTESHIETASDDILDDGTISDEEYIALMTGTSGRFSNTPYQLWEYSFGSQDVNQVFSYVSLPVFEDLRMKLITEGISINLGSAVKLLDANESAIDKIIKSRIGATTDKFWAVRVPLLTVFLPMTKFSIKVSNIFEKNVKSKTFNSPVIQLIPTSIKTADVKDCISTFVHDKITYAVIANTWPAVSIRVEPIADLTKHRFLSSLLPDLTDETTLKRQLETKGEASLSQIINKRFANAILVDSSTNGLGVIDPSIPAKNKEKEKTKDKIEDVEEETDDDNKIGDEKKD